MRRFEFIEGSSSKFWEAEVSGNSFAVAYGRVGSAGQRKEKAFASADLAQREMDRKVAEKQREGYVEIAVAGAAPKAPPKAALPPRFRPCKPTPAAIAGAADALAALEAVARRAELARRPEGPPRGTRARPHRGRRRVRPRRGRAGVRRAHGHGDRPPRRAPAPAPPRAPPPLAVPRRRLPPRGGGAAPRHRRVPRGAGCAGPRARPRRPRRPRASLRAGMLLGERPDAGAAPRPRGSAAGTPSAAPSSSGRRSAGPT